MEAEVKKLTRILVGVNTLTSIDQPVYSNHCQFWFRLGRSYTDCEFGFYTPRRASIDRMRNEVAKMAIAHNFDYVLFLDDDVLVPIDGLAKLMKANADIAAGWTIIRGWPFDNMFFKWEDPDKKEHIGRYPEPFEYDEDGNIPCAAVGFSFCLLKVSHLRKVVPPFFVTGTNSTEDVYYCIKSQKQIPDTKIVVVPSVVTGHLLGSEFITPENRPHYKTYARAAYPEMISDDKPIVARGDGYLAMVEDPTPANVKAHNEAGN